MKSKKDINNYIQNQKDARLTLIDNINQCIKDGKYAAVPQLTKSVEDTLLRIGVLEWVKDEKW